MDSSQQSSTTNSDIDPRLARKRVSRACDQCRRRKARCDGQTNCSACKAIGLSCSYGQAVKQARGPAYVAHLESNVASLSKQVEDLEFEARNLRPTRQDHPPSRTPEQTALLVETVTKEPRGKAFGIDLLRQLCNFCYDLPRPGGSHRQESALKIMQALDSPFSLDGFPTGGAGHPVLPQKDRLVAWIELAFQEALPLWHFVGKSQIEAILYRVYNTSSNGAEESDRDDLALIYALIALGQRFEITGSMAEEHNMQGLSYFAAARDAVPLGNCERSLSALQTTLCLAIYLKSVSAQTRFHAYVSAAASGALRMGLHEVIPGFPKEELAMRQRIWSAVRTMDVYASSALGLPSHFSSVVDNAPLSALESGKEEELMLADAHYKLASVVHRAVDKLYRGRTSLSASGAPVFGVPVKSLHEANEELETWANNCSFINSGLGSVERSQLLLCYAHHHAQLLLFTPFVHHLAQPLSDRKSEAYTFGKKCVQAALGAVSVASELQQRYQFNEAYFNAVEVLVYAHMALLIVELGSSDGEFLRDAQAANRRAKELLMNLALLSATASECLDALTPLYQPGSKKASFDGGQMSTSATDADTDYGMADGPSGLGSLAPGDLSLW
ncbi:unnamed protein product [Zymoseptoria tritici ST99CH_3D7]|uniref:Zn(2)-C6 fungal-type domain-containing protein n=1 Tax=Zymoseptoria tritici (strain ST99CH_3D7) TaxID=1276538 RepID=A0A1X7RJN5_ZYMT9|nr:unnamed protein product [Zymoseptoria tritici ST99CH_3D7]